TSALVGTATFHSFSRRIDLALHGQEVLLEPEGLFTRSHGFASPAFGGERLKWQYEGHGGGADMVLVNSRKEWMAKLEKKAARLVIGDGGISGGVALDEIVVSALAMMELEKRTSEAAQAASEAAGAAAGG
ncbi:MAG: hypothetical protein LQ352_008431, partial [Teloschistes flavicans]